MGGLGALLCALKSPAGKYRAVTAFAPISNPSEVRAAAASQRFQYPSSHFALFPPQCPWGVKAFSGYFGPDRALWREWDPTHLVASYPSGPAPLRIRLELGSADHFYSAKQLLPEHLIGAAESAPGVELKTTWREGYGATLTFLAANACGAVPWLRNHCLPLSLRARIQTTRTTSSPPSSARLSRSTLLPCSHDAAAGACFALASAGL
jgi:S-formylglutathione hydrolase